MMNIIDYLVGNNRQALGNWECLDTKINADFSPQTYDFNRAFYAYDNIDGANCQTTFQKNESKRSSGRSGKEDRT